LKEQRHVQDGIVRLLREKPRTVPEVAAALGLEPRQALWYLAAMRKYNLVAESGMSGDYPMYQLAEEH
jgi:DNA-binding IclR family transcriptional regulator